MTEEEWLVCTDPTPMLEFLRSKASNRKLRLFACACCRRIWHLVADSRSRKAVETSERYADGAASEAELLSVALEANDASNSGVSDALTAARLTAYAPHTFNTFTAAPRHAYSPEAFATAEAFANMASIHAAIAVVVETAGASNSSAREAVLNIEYPKHASLIREIFGNPFRPVTFDPSWRTLSVVSLAQTIYDERQFDKMPELGDAFERAGCRDEAILNHCREPGEHVRGCWVVDLALGKE